MVEFHENSEFEGEDTAKLEKMLEGSRHLSCIQVNNLHICIAHDLIAICPMDDDGNGGYISPDRPQTLVIPMPIFMHIANTVTEELIKDALFSAAEKEATRKASKLN